MLVRIVLALIGLAVLVCLAVLAWPQALGLEHTAVVAQVVAFRAAVAVIAVVLAVLLLIAMIPTRRLRGFFAFLSVVLLVFAGANVAVLASRGWVPGAGHAGTTAPAADSAVTVLSWNTLGGQVGAPEIARLALSLGAEVVALPETEESTATEVAALMAEGGTPVTPITTKRSNQYAGLSTSLLIATSLGEYATDKSMGDTYPLPSVIARPVNGDGPVLAAVHPVSPGPADMQNWRNDLDWIGRLCSVPGAIVAGDFNATLDHLTDLGQCRDAAADQGTAAIGSWPTWLPALIGTQIDHVMVTDGWKIVSARIIQTEDQAGSDHRPITATLERE